MIFSVKFIVRKDGMDMKIRIKFNGHLQGAFFTQLLALQPSGMAKEICNNLLFCVNLGHLALSKLNESAKWQNIAGFTNFFRYGDQTPKTEIGKIVTIIYALIGFPLMVICSRNNGIVMANCFRFIYWKCYKCCCGISTSQRHISESFELLIASFYLFEILKLTLSALLNLFEIKI